ncbi:uncharacterized protein LOC135160375 isoform X3 [Diachasmimorpha longicaudata]|uniref:uncharacterized protein LOC135160375 isoform X3 n=1 Tax=Diachasmimorpha longicaudata TaxID=58733 RepID=UPI0030B8FECE
MANAEEDVMVQYRAYWCETLERALECPICLEILRGDIYQCFNGHTVCQYCKKSQDTCPECSSEFSGIRARTVESIVENFREMKLSLLDPDHKINKVITSRKSVETQTTESTEAVPSPPEDAKADDVPS